MKTPYEAHEVIAEDVEEKMADGYLEPGAVIIPEETFSTKWDGVPPGKYRKNADGVWELSDDT